MKRLRFFKLSGIILGFNPFGKAHRVYTVFTRERGKVKVSAFGSGKGGRWGNILKTGNAVELVVRETSTELLNFADGVIIKNFFISSLTDVFFLFSMSETLNLLFPVNVPDEKVFEFLFREISELGGGKKTLKRVFRKAAETVFVIVRRSGFMADIPDYEEFKGREKVVFDGEKFGCEGEGIELSAGSVRTMRAILNGTENLEVPLNFSKQILSFCFGIVKRISGKEHLVSEELMDYSIRELQLKQRNKYL